MWHQAVIDTDYTHAFYPEMAPAHMAFALLARGHASPFVAGDGFSYAELGCGQGLTSMVLAALHPQARFTAIDLLPRHIDGAKALAAAAGADNLDLRCESFADFARRQGGADLDAIVLHGVWTWVDAGVRATLQDIAARRLRPGGVLYVSYNCLPGWGPDMPVRALLMDAVENAQGTLSQRIDHALTRLRHLADQGGYFADNPSAAALVETLQAKSDGYIAHEYLNRAWTPFTSAQVARDMDRAGLSFCASSTLLDHLDHWQVAPAHLPLPDGDETLRDVLTTRRFRRDLFVKAPRRLSPDERRAGLERLRFVLTVPVSDIPDTVTAPGGVQDLPRAIYRPLAEALAAGPCSLSDLPGDFETVVEALLVLVGLGLAAPSLETGDSMRCARLNAAILAANQSSPAIRQLAAPQWGTAVVVDFLDRLFLAVEADGAADVPMAVWTILSGRGKRLRRGGRWLEGEAENLAETRRLYDGFIAERRPGLVAAGAVQSRPITASPT